MQVSELLKGYIQRNIRNFVSLYEDSKKMSYWELLKKVYFNREAWWDKGDKIFVGEDIMGNKYWETTKYTEHGTFIFNFLNSIFFNLCFIVQVVNAGLNLQANVVAFLTLVIFPQNGTCGFTASVISHQHKAKLKVWIVL